MIEVNTTPDGRKLGWNETCLLLDGRPWMPVMGELHYTRIPREQWRSVLLKMKAGGLEVVASYVFWIHHEETEGQWDWSGRRDLRAFVETCADLGLKAVIRCGPWCHGEVRNGGLPDWLLSKPWAVRENNPGYLDHARRLYSQIYRQLEGLLWKDGGPVIAIQIENEYAGPAEHLLSLLEIAQDCGLMVPYYTRTGWPALSTPMPYGKLLPLFGVYAEGFWDRELTSMPGTYREGFRFSSRRTEAAIGTDQLGGRVASDEKDAHRYPYCTCEIGGGMMNSYHRRIRIDSRDVESTALVKVGSGGNLPGYYMYCGGINPPSNVSTLQESIASGYPNDLPVCSYDFQAPVGAAGQLRPHYFGLRRMHLLVQECGQKIARMRPVFEPGKQGAEFPQLALRSDGDSGLLFVSHYEREKAFGTGCIEPMDIGIGDDKLRFPENPLAVPDGSSFVWPLRWHLGSGVRLEWITAQALCSIEEGDTKTWFFGQTPGIPVQMATRSPDGQTLVEDLQAGRTVGKVFVATDKQVRIVVLTDTDARMLSKQRLGGKDYAFLSMDSLTTDGKLLQLEAFGKPASWLAAFPGLPKGIAGAEQAKIEEDGIFQKYDWDWPLCQSRIIPAELIREPREPVKVVYKGKADSEVPAAPDESAFGQAGRWRLDTREAMAQGKCGLLRIVYCGDVLRVFVDGRMVYDDFCNGRAVELNPQWWSEWTCDSIIEVEILPLRADSPVFMPEDLKPESGWQAELESVQWLPQGLYVLMTE